MGVDYVAERVSKAEVARTAARIVASAVPIAGGPAVELINHLFEAPLTRRREEWMERLAGDLIRLEDEHNNLLASLVEDPRFLSLLVESSRAAMAVHQDEKRRALRNFLVNAALKPDSDADREQSILSLISRITPSHLAVLDGRPADVTRPVSYEPDSRRVVDPGNVGFVRYLSADLVSLGLFEHTSADNVRLSEMGRALLDSICDPFPTSRPDRDS